MSEFNISLRYANALMEQAKSVQALPVVAKDIELIDSVLRANKDLKNVLANPIIKSEKKQSIIEEIFSDVSKETKNFLTLILKKNRENILHHITEKFIDLKNSFEGIVAVEIASAVELNETQKKGIITKLESYTGKRIQADYKIDDSLIGGFTVMIKDSVIDASIKHQLEKLKKTFSEKSYLLN